MDQFAITDSTINTGIFRPKGHDSVWIFITKEKTSDRTQYVDHLDGDDLYFEGQTAGRKDHLIAESSNRGLELLLFYREKKNEFPDYSFRYEGPFKYVSSTNGPPTKFRLTRCAPTIGVLTPIQLVNTLSQIRENIRRFSRDVPQNLSLFHSLLPLATEWVHDQDEGTFAPVIFAAYPHMSFARFKMTFDSPISGGEESSAASSAVQALAGPFSHSDALSSQFNAWISQTQKSDFSATFNPEVLRFAALPPVRNYWALLCNPEVFAIDQAIKYLTELVWTVGASNPAPGDRAIVWQSKGDGERRGVVAACEVIQEPRDLDSPTEELPFWRGPVMGPQRRIRLRILRLPKLPLWEADAPWLSELAVAKARGGKAFSLSAVEWQKIITSAGESLDEITEMPDSPMSGQHYGLSASARKAVELHAQRLVEEHFLSEQFEVEDVSRTSPFDLRCTKGEDELHVEVKGTTTDGASVFLTRNEVEHARKHPEKMVLAIVDSIRLNYSDTIPVAHEGKLRFIRQWNVDEGILRPLQYEYFPQVSAQK